MAVQFGTNVNVQKKRVKFYNRSGSAVTIYEGMPVCYMFDTTVNVLGYDKGAGGLPNCQTSPDSTAEGYQNEGKFLIVELPYTDNQQWFAGVTTGAKNGKSVAATSYEWIEIYEPNGAIVPVRVDIDTTVGRTILALEDDSQALTQLYSANYTSRAVAIAEETVSGGTSARLCLAKLEPNIFICQDLSSGSLIMATAGAASCALNRINVTTGATSGEMAAFEIKMNCTGGINSPWGLCAYFRARHYAAMTDRCCAVGVIMAMESGSSSLADLLAALRVKLVCNTGATVSSMFNMHVLNLEADVDVTGPDRFSWIHCASIGTNAPNFFIDALDAGDLGDWAETDHITTSATGDRIIPVRIGNTTYHLVAYANDGLA